MRITDLSIPPLRRPTTLALLLLMAPLRLHAQPDPFEHITVAEGLPENSAFAVLQDHLGFLWIGTQNGLVRYDGYDFTTFKPDPDDPYSLAARGIRTIFEDREGDLWLGSWAGGLHRFDRTTERFERLGREPDDPNSPGNDMVLTLLEDDDGDLWTVSEPDTGAARLGRFDRATGTFAFLDLNAAVSIHEVGAMTLVPFYRDRSGMLWVGTDAGLYRVAPGTELPTPYPAASGPSDTLGRERVLAIYEDRQGTLWAGTDAGLYRRTPPSDAFERYTEAPVDEPVLAIYEDRQGTLWAGTDGGGLYRLDRATGAFTRYRHDPGDPPALGHDQVYVLHEDRDGCFWVLTAAGLYRLDRATGAFTYYPYAPDAAVPLSGTFLTVVYEDRTGVLWIGTQARGLHKLAHSTRKFELLTHNPGDANSLSDSRVRAIYEDHEGALWIGTSDGLNRLDRATGAVTHYRHDPTDPTSLSDDMAYAIYEDREGAFWIGTDGGLNRLDRATGAVTHYRHDPTDPTSLSDDDVRAIYEDTEGILWVGTWDGGLNRFDRDSGTFSHYVNVPGDPSSISHNRIFDILEGRDGALWIAAVNLNRFDPLTGRFSSYKDERTAFQNVTTLHEDRAGRLWAGTFNGGLHRFDRATGTSTPVFTEQDGLLNDRVLGILEDDAGRLWISTLKGLSRFDPETRGYKNYDVSDGLLAVPFYARAAHRSPSGELFFGGLGGLVAFRPDQIRGNPVPPQLALTGFRLAGNPVTIGEGSPLRQPISVARSLDLAHHQNDFSLSFAALHYSKPEKNRYAFTLEGYDTEWRDVGTQREATYMNLEPGQYVFRVRGANQDGVWNKEGASIRITIRPPWWRTNAAYLGYALALLGLLFGADRFQRARLIRQERQRAEIEQAELRAEAADALARVATAQTRELEAEAKALHAENERKQLALNKARELEEAYRQLKATQAQLIHAEKLASLGQLTAGIAHEIKNPLNFVNNFAELIAEQMEELSETMQALQKSPETAPSDAWDDLLDLLDQLKLNAEQVFKHGHRADGIVRSMLEHSRGAPGVREATDLNRLVAEYLKLSYHGVRASEPGFQAQLDEQYAPDLPPVVLVQQEISRVLLNVFNNAFFAVHERAKKNGSGYTPTVSVRTRQLGDAVEVVIRDNGTGIPAEIRDKIFEPFFSTKPTGTGTGLGLSISYDIVTQGHQGTLRVESEEDAYTAFILTLPA